jgi:hypothetical protein
MPRVVPSQIVEFIDLEFPFARPEHKGQPFVDPIYRNRVTALLRLVDALPDGLLIMDGADYNKFVLSVSTMKSALEFADWTMHSGPTVEPNDRGLGIAICNLRAGLVLVPDEQIPAATADLLLITDPQLRESIRADIGFANQAFSGGEWKAATVLAGAAAEALLLWAITEKNSSSDVEKARAAVIPSRPKDATFWGLDEYIKVASALQLIEGETEKQAHLAREFRNFIHPGRTARTAKVCDRGTALSALAALEFIVRDLS